MAPPSGSAWPVCRAPTWCRVRSVDCCIQVARASNTTMLRSQRNASVPHVCLISHPELAYSWAPLPSEAAGRGASSLVCVPPLDPCAAAPTVHGACAPPAPPLPLSRSPPPLSPPPPPAVSVIKLCKACTDGIKTVPVITAEQIPAEFHERLGEMGDAEWRAATRAALCPAPVTT